MSSHSFYHDIGYINEIHELQSQEAIPFFRSGYNPVVGTDPTHVWTPGGIQVFPSVPSVVSVVSTSAADAVAGIGAHTIQVYGLDTNYLRQTETVTLTGTTPALGLKTFWRVTRIEVLTAGSNGANVGQIDLSMSGDVQACMPIGDNSSQNGNYTVPGNYWLFVSEPVFMAETGRDIRARIKISNPFLNGGLWRTETVFISPSPGVSLNSRPFLQFPPATDLVLEVTKLSGAAGEASVVYTGYLGTSDSINTTDLTLEDHF